MCHRNAEAKRKGNDISAALLMPSFWSSLSRLKLHLLIKREELKEKRKKKREFCYHLDLR